MQLKAVATLHRRGLTSRNLLRPTPFLEQKQSTLFPQIHERVLNIDLLRQIYCYAVSHFTKHYAVLVLIPIKKLIRFQSANWRATIERVFDCFA